jgi:hypothetical protein
MLLKVEHNQPIFAYIIHWKVLSRLYAYVILIGALLFPHTQFFSLQHPIIPVHMYYCGIRNGRSGSVWRGGLTFSVRTFNVFSPVLRMKSE